MVKLTAQRLHSLPVLLGQGETGVHGPRPLGEKLHGLRLDQRLEHVLPLSADSQRGPAGDKQPELRTVRQQAGGEAGGFRHIFEPVEQQQRVAVFQIGVQRFGQVLSGALFDPQRLCDRQRDQVRMIQGGELNQTNPVLEGKPGEIGGFKRQARLPDPGRSGDGQQACRAC